MTKRKRDEEELMMKNLISMYLKEIQETLRDDEGLMTQFVTVMRELKAKEIDHATVGSRVKVLFKDHDNLLVGFNVLLPKKKEKVCIPDKTLARVFDFIKRVRVQIFQGQNRLYSEFLNHVMSRNNKWVFNALDCNSDLLREYKEIVADAVNEEAAKAGPTKPSRGLVLSKLKKYNPNYDYSPEDNPNELKKDDLQVLNNYFKLKKHNPTPKNDLPIHSSSRSTHSPPRECFNPCISKLERIRLRYDDIRALFETLVGIYQSTETNASELLREINENNREDVPIDYMKEKFTSKNLKCIAQLYGIEGLRIVDTLFEDPRVSLPEIMTGIKEKITELRKHYVDLNRVCAGVMKEIETKESKRWSIASCQSRIKKMEDIMKKEHRAILGPYS